MTASQSGIVTGTDLQGLRTPADLAAIGDPVATVLSHTTVIALLAYVIWLAVGPHFNTPSRDTFLSDAVLALASVTALVRALQQRRPFPWFLLAVGMALWTTGDCLFTFVVEYKNPIPTPSIADPFYLSFYPLAYAALVLLVRGRVRHFHASATLDGLIVALGIAAFGSITVRSVVHQGADTLVGAIVNAAYPIGDLLLMIIGVGCLVLLGWRAGRYWWSLILGCVVFFGSDTGYLLWSGYHPGTMLDAGWPTAMVLFAISPRPQPTERVSFDGSALLVLPTLAGLSSIGFLVAAVSWPLPFVGVLLAAGALLAVLIRFGLTFREVSALAITRQQALTDDLTGLANRRSLYQRLDTLLTEGRASEPFALILLDLDQFKEINDALGHVVGDQMLQQLADRLLAQLSPRDLIARLGGDEFAIILSRISDAAPIGATLNNLVASFDSPFDLGDMTVHMTASFGLALFPTHATGRSDLLRCADVAMYTAKRSRENVALYSRAADTNSVDRLLRIEQLRTAIGLHQLVCYYQPKVNLRTRSVVGAEALVRWEHPVKGTLEPSSFLPLADQTGLMNELTMEVMGQAFQQCRQWRAMGHQLKIAINLSVINLLNVSFPQQVGALLSQHGLEGDAVTFEITEDTLMADPEGARKVLEALRALGVRLSIDDYGTGYSSLTYLHDLPVDELKIDRSFVTGIAGRPRARSIVEATLILTRSIGIVLVAEGVETASDWRELMALDVDEAQGYWLSKPLDPEKFAMWLEVNDRGSNPRPRRVSNAGASRPSPPET